MKRNLDYQSSTEFIYVLVELIDSRKKDYLERYHIKQQNKCIKNMHPLFGTWHKIERREKHRHTLLTEQKCI